MGEDAGKELVYYTNYDLQTLVTPVKVEVLNDLLKQAQYPDDKRQFIVQGFSNGFDLGYKDPLKHANTAENIPLWIGNSTILWNKIMKEVKAGRFAGPFENIPYANFMQSPIGLVPKSGNKTRLIFHLSYQFKSGLGSLNSNTPDELCTVKYKDLDHAKEYTRGEEVQAAM